MDVIAKDRQQGKTTELIRMAADEWLYIVEPNLQAVRYIKAMAADMGLRIPMPVTWAEFVDGRYYGRGINGFVIDNLDLCIQQMTAVPVRAISVTVPESVPAQ